LLRDLIGLGARAKRGRKGSTRTEFPRGHGLVSSPSQAGHEQSKRYKGLGEMNPAQLWENHMDPKVRRLMKVQTRRPYFSRPDFHRRDGERSRTAPPLH